MTIEKRRLALIEETITHYTLKNRGEIKTSIGSKCIYSPTPTSEGCAIGRLIADKEVCKAMDVLAGCVNDPKLESLLPTEIKELGVDFLLALQRLHDGEDNWSDNGLTLSGISTVNSIKNQFSLN